MFVFATVKMYPNYWPGHYYLGHTYLALGRREDARKEYEACLASQPPPGQDVLDICKKTIVSLGGTLPEGSPVPALTDSKLSDAKPSDNKVSDAKPADETKPPETAAGEKKDETESYREKERRLNIERVRKQGAERVAAIREELKEALAAGDANSSRWVKAPDGTQTTHMNDDDRAAIERDYQARITKVEEDTERHVAALH